MGVIGAIASQFKHMYVDRNPPMNDNRREGTRLHRMGKLTRYRSSVYRLNTYPLIHLGFLHTLLNTLSLAPLLERFEADHGTLLTAAMFVGRMYASHKQMNFHQLTVAASIVHSSCCCLPFDRAWAFEREYTGHGRKVRRERPSGERLVYQNFY